MAPQPRRSPTRFATRLFLSLPALLALAGSAAAQCCADGTREAFADAAQFPDMCGCAVSPFGSGGGSAWSGFRSLAEPRASEYSPSAAACAPGFSVCSYAQLRSNLAVAGADDASQVAACNGAGAGTFLAAFSHADIVPEEDAIAGLCQYTRAPPGPFCHAGGYGSEPVCCGTGCFDSGVACRDMLWPGATRIGFSTWDNGQGCGSIESGTAGGVLCCRDAPVPTTSTSTVTAAAHRTPTPVPVCPPDLTGRPGNGVAWPECTSADQQYCYEFTAFSATEGGSIFAWAALLDDNSVNWAVRWSNDGQSLPASVEGLTFQLVLRTGSLAPRYTSALSRFLVTDISGDPCNGTSRIAFSGQPTVANWLNYDAVRNCFVGQCGDNTTRAEIQFRVLSGNTQNMALWSDDERNIYEGMEVSTNAQYRPTVLVYGAFPVPSLLFTLGNPHLPPTGSDPCRGTMLIYAPERFWLASGFASAREAWERIPAEARLLRSDAAGAPEWLPGSGTGELSFLSMSARIVADPAEATGMRVVGIYLYVGTTFSTPTIKLEFKEGGDAGSPGGPLKGVAAGQAEPLPPLLRSATGLAGERVRLAFDAAPGAEPDAFRASCTLDSADFSALVLGTAGEAVVRLPGSAGRSVKCRVRAGNAAGFGGASADAQADVPPGKETSTTSRTLKTRTRTATTSSTTNTQTPTTTPAPPMTTAPAPPKTTQPVLPPVPTTVRATKATTGPAAAPTTKKVTSRTTKAGKRTTSKRRSTSRKRTTSRRRKTSTRRRKTTRRG
ncbi:hypothetical protein DFJ74DRAFT_765370 [Hyaloraphidium curvatum]|nr:hypothetical protein DFJ74DRAFT_765370 [Hyaloraphidium curvatum]